MQQPRSETMHKPLVFRDAIIRFTLALVMAIGLVGLSLDAARSAPSPGSERIEAGFQVPEWMSDETATRFNIGIDVLAPSYVPAPFGGEPEIQAYSGFYSLYWLIPGAPPTYLRISGEAGGVIPDFSYYDRNIQLTQNATVQGYPAYHDVSPIYDIVYWQVGNVVYTVDSHNLAGDDSLSLANSLMLLTPPQTSAPQDQVAEEPSQVESAPDAGSGTGGEEGNVVQQPTQEPSVLLAAPSAVLSGDLASVSMEGMSEAYLVTDGGYFPVSGEAGTVIVGGTAVDWQAPEVEENVTVTLSLYELGTDRYITAVQTLVQGSGAPQGAATADIQCPAEASIGKQARVRVVGSGALSITASDGSWPAEPPNTNFQSDAAGDVTLVGSLPSDGAATLSWLAPAVPMTAVLSVTDADGTLLDECGIDVVLEDVSGDLGPESSENQNTRGDGTGISEAKPEVVARIMANPIGFAGDATGGPEANGPDYGLEPPADSRSTASGANNAATGSQGSNDGMAEADLGPVSGPNGMVAMLMDSSGGTLACPSGATAVVPPGAIPGEATVTIAPVADTKLPETPGVTLVPGTAFDLTFNRADGRAVEDLEAPVSLTIALKSAQTGQGARIYRVSGMELSPLDVTHSDSGSVSAEVRSYGRLVVGVPDPVAQASAGIDINPFLIGGFGVLALLCAGLLFSRGLQRKKTRMIPVRRPIASSRVRYR